MVITITAITIITTITTVTTITTIITITIITTIAIIIDFKEVIFKVAIITKKKSQSYYLIILLPLNLHSNLNFMSAFITVGFKN